MLKPLLTAACFWVTALTAAATDDPPLPDGLYAQVTTPRGTVVSQLFFKKAPMTCASFVGLAEGTLGPKPGTPFFDGTIFHRVVPGFVVQGGDPTGKGNGGPGYQFPDEIAPGLTHKGMGVMQMANSGPDTNGSQFCFMLCRAPHLDYAHTIFGEVVRGLDLLPQIQQGDTMKVNILRVGEEAQAFRVSSESFAEMVKRAPRAPQPLFEDTDALLAATAPHRARYLANKLLNVRRFTDNSLYVRLISDLEAQTISQVRKGLHLPKEAHLVLYDSRADRWHLSSPLTQLKLPEYPKRRDKVLTEAQEASRVAKSANAMINGLIHQLEQDQVGD